MLEICSVGGGPTLNIPATQLLSHSLDILSVIDYEKLEVYRSALQFIAVTLPFRDGAPKGSGELLDQFKRASSQSYLRSGTGTFIRLRY